MKKNQTSSVSSQGYSLLELVLVLAIVSVLVGLLLPKGFDALRNARIQQVEKTVDTLKTALTDYLSMAGGNGSLPRTEGTGVPTSGAALTGATDVAKGNAARLDTVLLATGKIERPLSLRMGTQSFASTGTGNEVTWSQAALGFVMTPDAAPLRNWSTVTRVEARTANPALAPSAALGANFRLDGATNFSANYVVAYLVIPACPAKDAYELALSMNGAQLAPVEGAASDTGVVAYAAPANGVTDVYIYLTAIKALTVLLWGDRWWLAGRTDAIPFAHRDEAAGELVAALAGDAPRRLRLIYQPDGFMSVVTPCPKAGRRTMALALQEQFPGLATDEIAWSHDPILSVGESFTTVLHCESSPWLFALIGQLGSAGIAVEEVWPLPTWLQALPDEWSDTGALTVLAIAGNRACAYHHPATGARQVIAWPPNEPTSPELWLANLLDRDPAEPVLVVTDEPAARAAWSPGPTRPGLRHLTVAEALAHSATIPSRHPARLLPGEPVVTASRTVFASSLALLIAAVGVVVPWVVGHVNARNAALVQTVRERALSADIAHLRINAAEIAALREDAAGRTKPFAGALLRRLASTVPPEVTLATLRADAGSFAAQGFVATQASNGVLDRWQQALAQDREWSQVQIESLPKSDGAFRLRGQGKT